MASLDHAQLASLVSSVGEHATRSATLAERLDGDGEAEAAASLYEAERSLRMAERAIDRARRSLEG